MVFFPDRVVARPVMRQEGTRDGQRAAGPLRELRSGVCAEFGSTPTTVRKAISTSVDNGNDGVLYGALLDCPIVDRGDEINPSKFGRFLRKNVNRICAGYEFEEAKADGRLAWRLIDVEKRRGTSAAGDSGGDAPPAASDIPF